MARASTSRTAKPARALPPPYQEANHRVAQQAVAELLVAPLAHSIPVQSLREHHLQPC